MNDDDVPPHAHLRVTNPAQLVLDLHKAGYSRQDILWILEMIDWLEPLRQALRDSTDGPAAGLGNDDDG